MFHLVNFVKSIQGSKITKHESFFTKIFDGDKNFIISM
jgi:hypothetical protein